MVEGGRNPTRSFDDLKEELLDAAYPSQDRIREIEAAADLLLSRISDTLHEMELDDVEARIVGSVAKGTMMKDPDIDVFLLFPRDRDPEELEVKGLKVASLVLGDTEKRYTQHPYMTGRFQGILCDIVPCYRIAPGDSLSTAVDRTPLHTEYINERLSPDQRKEVVLLKSFLKGIGSYGAEDTVQGFSGYLVELLVLKFGNMIRVIEWLTELDINVSSPGGCEEIGSQSTHKGPSDIIVFDKAGMSLDDPKDPAYYQKLFENDILVVVDPVDSGRNVASPISIGTLSYTSRAARAFIKNPKESFFFPFSKRPITPISKGSKDITRNGENYFELDLPKGDPGVVITQLRSSLNKMLSSMVRDGFHKVIIRYLLVFPKGTTPDQSYRKARNCWYSDNDAPGILINVLTEPSVLPLEYKHWGPPLHNPRVRDFRLKWGDDARIDDAKCRAYTVRRRELVHPREICIDFWEEAVHGSLLRSMDLKGTDGVNIEMGPRVALSGNFNPWNL